MSDNGNYPDVNPLDWETVQPYVDQLLAEPLGADSVEPWLKKWSGLVSVIDETEAQIYRDVTENTADEAAEERFKQYIEVILPQTSIANQALKQKLLSVEDYEPTGETAVLMQRFQTEADIFHEDNVPIESKLEMLGNDYNKIVGAMNIEWQGETETLPQAMQHLESRDRQTRKAVWRLIMERYLQDRDRLNELYLEMLPLRRQIAPTAGLSDFRAYRWQKLSRFDYTPEDCFTFHDAIEHEVVPLASELYRELAGQLQIDQVRPWDTQVDPYGEPLHPFEDVAQLEAGAQRIFDNLDPVLGGYFAVMRDGYLDLESRPNKAPGGYCNEFPVSGKPYIFMNAVGTHQNVSTLLHEGGHAFHVMESQHQPLIWNHNAQMEFCEVASMSMELLTAPYWRKEQGGFYQEADARRAQAQELKQTVFFLPYMAVVDAFQHWVYVDAPESVSSDELDAKWSDLLDRFMPGVDYSGFQAEKETGWHRKGHIFGVPFYYVEYGLAQLGALQVWRNALQDQSKAIADYRAALALGYTRSLPELFQVAGATFAFDRQIVGELMTLIRDQLALLET
ncbi:MAG: M3 family oligoendopeptidase [Chloroflexota bacterium]|nr:M3 family oligoendopeptidase [Chloroflexota bacterium]